MISVGLGIVLLIVALAGVAAATVELELADGVRTERTLKRIAFLFACGALGASIGAIFLLRWKSSPLRIGAVLLLVALGGNAVARNFLAATSRSPLKRTLADMRSLATAIEAYRVDNNEYPVAATLDELAAKLEPRYIRAMPRVDGWDFPLRYAADENGTNSTFFLGSGGKRGAWERPKLSDYEERTTRDPTDDIVWRNDGFLQGPEGAKRR